MHIPFLPASFLRKQIRVCAHSCCIVQTPTSPSWLDPSESSCPHRKTHGPTCTPCARSHTHSHLTPSRSGSRTSKKLLTAVVACRQPQLPLPLLPLAPPSAPCEAGGATDWLICPVSSGTRPCPWLPCWSVSPSGAGTVVLSLLSSRGSDRSHTRLYLQKQWVPEMKPAPEDLGVCWGSGWHSWGTVGHGCKSGCPILATMDPWPCLPKTGAVVVVIAGVHCVLPV